VQLIHSRVINSLSQIAVHRITVDEAVHRITVDEAQFEHIRNTYICSTLQKLRITMRVNSFAL